MRRLLANSRLQHQFLRSSSGKYAGYYGGPPPAGHPEISQAMSALQHAKYVLQDKAVSDFHGHKANAIGDIDNAIGELQTCMSMP